MRLFGLEDLPFLLSLFLSNSLFSKTQSIRGFVSFGGSSFIVSSEVSSGWGKVDGLRNVHQQRVRLEVDAISRLGHDCCDVASGFQSSQFEESWWSLHGLTQHLGCSSLTRGLNNGRLFVLHGLLNLEFCSLSLLLSNLFLFNGSREFGPKRKISDRNIVENDEEIAETFVESVTNLLRDLFSLGEQLRRIVSGYDRLENLVDDWGKYTCVVVKAQITVHWEEFLAVRPIQHSQTNVHRLEIFGASGTLYFLRLRAYVVDNGAFEPGRLKVPPFFDYFLWNTRDFVEFEGSLARLDYFTQTKNVK